MTRAGASARWPLILLAVYTIVWIALAVAPSHRKEWLLENLLAILGVPVLVWGWSRLRFSSFAYTCLFLFLLLAALGAHYTYAEVPYDRWAERLAGISISEWFDFERNHYDRLVHFCFGLLITPAVIELLDAKAQARGVLRWLAPLTLVMSLSGAFELVEWAAALVFGQGRGAEYLGAQGDEWDAHKDMALASLGALLALPWLLKSRMEDGGRRAR